MRSRRSSAARLQMGQVLSSSACTNFSQWKGENPRPSLTMSFSSTLCKTCISTYKGCGQLQWCISHWLENTALHTPVLDLFRPFFLFSENHILAIDISEFGVKLVADSIRRTRHGCYGCFIPIAVFCQKLVVLASIEYSSFSVLW
jgi:hypothetical protein